MHRRTFVAAVALLVVTAALASAVLLGDASLGLRTAVAVGAVAVVTGGLVLYAGLRRWYLLGRYVTTRPTTVDETTDLESGTDWVRVVGEVAGPRDVTSARTGEDVAGRTLRLERRTHPFALRWPGVDRTVLGEETELGTLALVANGDRVRFESDGTEAVAAPTDRTSFGASHEPSFSLLQALQRHDREFAAVTGEGRFGPHRLHVSEATFESGQRVQVFGLLTVEADGGPPTLRPAEGRGGTAAVGRGHRLPLYFLRGGVAGLAGAGVLLYLGWSVLSLVLT